MIPFFQLHTLEIGPITIQVWGVFVALGILAAIVFAYFLCKKYLLSGELILDISIWALVGGLLMARIFHVVFYNPVYFVENPIEVFKVWHGGASSLGGFVGAALSVWLFAKKRRFVLKELLPYFDIGILSLWLGWGIGRIGCFLIHDHPGTLTHSIVGVNYPGGARFDLGLMESILGFILFIIFYLLFKKLIKMSWGLVAILSIGLYAVARFFLDFLRIPDNFSGADARYANLTPAQWGMIAILVGLTLYLILAKMKRQKTNGEVA